MKTRYSYNFGKVDQLVFLGGSSLLTRILEGLNGPEKVFVFTAERLLGEPSHMAGQSFRAFLESRNIPFHVSEDINKDPRVKEVVTPGSVGISVSGPWILRRPTLELFGHKVINAHGQKLPRNRGGGGFSWSIMQGIWSGYVAYHFVTEGLDDGDLVSFREIRFPASVRSPAEYEEIHRREMAGEGIALIKKIGNGEDFFPLAQMEQHSSYWPRLNTDLHGFVDWSWNASDIVKFIWAFADPWNGAQTFVDASGAKVRLKAAALDASEAGFHPFQYGIVYRKTENYLYVAARGGTVLIDGITDDQGVSLREKITVGSRLYTPREDLEKALSTRVRYGAGGVL